MYSRGGGGVNGHIYIYIERVSGYRVLRFLGSIIEGFKDI